MNVIISVHNKNISIRFLKYAIKIYNDAELTGLLQQNIQDSTADLIILIKKKYVELFNVDFSVLDASMAIEIWAHVYMQKIAEVIKKISSLKFINKIMDKIIYHCQEIDIGEKGHDDNRFVWNWLAVFKPLITRLFF